MNQVGILGCGWLGVGLAEKLTSDSFGLKVSRTSLESIAELKAKGWDAHQIFVANSSVQGNLEFFENLDQLIVSIPPGRANSSGYFEKISSLLKHLKSYPRCRIIFLSSTSVYGKKGGVYNESSSVFPETEAAKALVQSERLIVNSPHSSLVVRLGGLIGADRNPIFSLYKKLIPNPNGRINFISKEDAVLGLFQLIKHTALEGIFNIVHPHHHTRREYYLKMATKYELPTPNFKDDEPAVERFIQATKIEFETEFRYTVDNLLID